MDAADVPDLTSQLVAEYGDVLPPGLIASTVETAASLPPTYPDEPDLRTRARDDVAALAEARHRSGSTGR